MERETFIHPSGKRESEVDINEVRGLGSGTFGWVREAVVSKGNVKRTMALKHFFKGREQAQSAFDNYKLAKKAGLKVFTTYRISKEGDAILMTNGNDKETVCLSLSPKEDRPKALDGESIEKIENFDELLQNLYQEAEKATKNGLYFNGDEIFFLVDKKTKTKVSFVLGDMDGISVDPMRFEGVPYDNIAEVGASVVVFLDKYMSPEVSEAYAQKVREFFSHKKQSA
ncbi:MAG: hypothetical protein WC817_02335 [Patescibacteria group bacterium]|jgi:hypothetical protein